MMLKKTLLIGLVGAMTLPTLAQKVDLTSAIIERTKRKNITKAKEYIDKAHAKIEAGSTLKPKDLGKFWHNRGMIYMDVYKTDSNMATLEIAHESFNKDMAIAESAFTKKSKNQLNLISNLYLKQAYKFADNEQYKESLAPFKKVFEIYDVFNYTDTNNIYYASVMALNGEEYETSIMYSEQLIGFKPKFESYHINKLNAYSKLDDKDAYIKALNESKKQCPECQNVILEEVNYYIGTGETDKLLASLNDAISATPNNATLHFAKGATVSGSDRAAAKAAYLKSIEIDPTYSDAYNNLSAIYMEEANEIADKMGDLGFSSADQAQHKKYKAERKEIFKEAKPYMEKAVELDDKNKSILNALMNVYYELGETDKWKETKAKFDAVK